MRVGDIVIKKTGGDKMIVSDYYAVDEKKYLTCYWSIGKELIEDTFEEKDIVNINEYFKYLKVEERRQKIRILFKNKINRIS